MTISNYFDSLAFSTIVKTLLDQPIGSNSSIITTVLPFLTIHSIT